MFDAVVDDVIPVFAGLNTDVPLAQTLDALVLNFDHAQVEQVVSDHNVAAATEHEPIFGVVPDALSVTEKFVASFRNHEF
jgi:hypothetical protein